MIGKFFVAMDEDYYPHIEYFDTEAEAVTEYAARLQYVKDATWTQLMVFWGPVPDNFYDNGVTDR